MLLGCFGWEGERTMGAAEVRIGEIGGRWHLLCKK